MPKNVLIRPRFETMTEPRKEKIRLSIESVLNRRVSLERIALLYNFCAAEHLKTIKKNKFKK